jgi:hypothetical protein
MERGGKKSRGQDRLELTPEFREIRMKSAAAASSSRDPVTSLQEAVCPSSTAEDIGKSNGSLVESSGILARSRSDVWKNFSLTEEGGVRFAVCKICAKKLKQSKTAGTGTLRNHILTHRNVSKAGGSGKTQTTIKVYHSNSGPSSAAYAHLNLLSTEQRQRLVQWMVRRNIPFSEVEDTSFRSFVFCLNDNVKMTSRSCARADIMRMYDEMFVVVTRRFDDLLGSICVSVDGWSSECQRRNYIAIVVTFIENWERKNVLLSLKTTEHESHTGEVIANLVYSELRRFGLHTKLFAMASDNGSNMVAAWPLLVDLCAKDGTIVDEDMHARCVCHVINIAVRAFLKDIGANLSVSAAQLSDPDHECNTRFSVHARSVNFVRFLTSYVHSSPKRLSKFKNSQRVSNPDSERIILPISETITRWNSTYQMLQRAQQISGALSVVLVGESTLPPLFPGEDTWNHVDTVLQFLEPFYKITLELEGNKSLTNAVPSYNELFDHLEDWEEYIDARLSSSTSVERGQWLAAIAICKQVLSKYYSKTDSRLYACVTYCDPRMREWYWTEAGYEDEWIARAREQVREVYNTRYALHGRAISQSAGTVSGSEDSVQRAMKKRAIFASDELSLYQQGGPAPSNFDPLTWWSMHSAEFPGLARMSLDLLAIPATTAQVERVFSQTKLILTDGRSVLDAELAGKIASLGSWFRELGIGK